MNREAKLRCQCGAVEGRVTNASPKTVNRVVCYCDDCQAFAHQLKRADLLDAHGGSDVIQVAPATLSFDRGAEHIACLRLGPKGLFRFYADCCKTPLGNTVSPAVPFVGIHAKTFVAPDDDCGPPVGGILGKFAVGTPPEGTTGLNVKVIARALRLVAGWKLGGKTWPHPFFDKGSSEPRCPTTIVSKSARESLRALCGPKATA